MRRIKKIKRDIKDIKDRLKRLECEHQDTDYYWIIGQSYVERCLRCDKVIRWVSYEEKVKKELSILEEQVKQKKREIGKDMSITTLYEPWENKKRKH